MGESTADILKGAVQAYNFPAVSYDFGKGCQRIHLSIGGVENQIRAELLYPSLQAVKDALSNILYWGYARTGYRDTRVRDFRDKVTSEQLSRALDLFHSLAKPGAKSPGLCSIRSLGLPQFSGMSFISKVRMFLDPSYFVVLDLKLLSLRTQSLPTVFREVMKGPKEVMIRITQHNEQVYDIWNHQCRCLSEKYLQSKRAVDVERAIFHLVGTDHSEMAARILQDEECCG